MPEMSKQKTGLFVKGLNRSYLIPICGYEADDDRSVGWAGLCKDPNGFLKVSVDHYGYPQPDVRLSNDEAHDFCVKYGQ